MRPVSKVFQLVAEHSCYVCGCEVDKAFLREWNGEEVCKFCINELNEEAEQHVSTNHH